MANATHLEHDHTTEHSEGGSWKGASEPFNASYGKLMMWYFLLSDAFTFAGFLITYGALRFSMPTWPLPDYVFSSLPGGIHHKPLIFVTIMTFILIFSSVTMVRAVQEGHHNNKRGVVMWMFLTILGGAAFLGCQAWEWTTLIGGEKMSVTRNTFGTHIADGEYLTAKVNEHTGAEEPKYFKAGETYLIEPLLKDGEEVYDEKGEIVFDKRAFVYTQEGELKGKTGKQEFGPRAFGALFFFITGFHGFHVFSGLVFLTLIMLNVMSGLYEKRANHYEMVEKIGLYWHFVDLVWVFVFLVFYLI